ncbi:hypothetical protein M0R45_013490 [Rubus argutus]|uniref:Uncharacterized protein n=1 Tax=Rubus argutus TaxID=59490 RepID=A0AAW1XIF1_RUBAR
MLCLLNIKAKRTMVLLHTKPLADKHKTSNKVLCNCVEHFIEQVVSDSNTRNKPRAPNPSSRASAISAQLHHLDDNSLGLQAVAADKVGQTRYATSIAKSMLHSRFPPSRQGSERHREPLCCFPLFYAVLRGGGVKWSASIFS